ncbi:MAG: hypothetical protein ACJ8DQ_10225 [Xanthobacteraceae bacterium]|jgi:hypothetical protein
MPRWPINLLLKLFAEPRIAIGGAAATAEAFLPVRPDAPAIFVAHGSARAHARAAARRWSRRASSRRRLAS